MTPLLWTLIAIQIAMGAFDTFYHHEMTERLAWRPSQRHELRLHGVRNILYALLFLVLGWSVTGLLIGMAPGAYELLGALMRDEEVRGAWRKVVNGLLGGTVGGLLGEGHWRAPGRRYEREL